jgi:signal transduction histidine kinase
MDKPVIMTDGEKLSLALERLVENAVKFSSQGGSIRVTVAKEDRWIAFSVEDDGEGVSPESLPDLFTGFVQAEDAMIRKHGGMGTGLFLVKRIAELLSGKLEVQSEPGKGSLFKILVPDLALTGS